MLRVSGKQNSLFPADPVIKCLLTHAVIVLFLSRTKVLNTYMNPRTNCVSFGDVMKFLAKNEGGGGWTEWKGMPGDYSSE